MKICDFKNAVKIDSNNQKDLDSFDRGIDLKGLGIICYYLYFGHLPFQSANYQKQLKEVWYHLPKDKEIPVEVLRLIEKLLQKKHVESDIDKIMKENELFTKDVKDYKYNKISEYVNNDFQEKEFGCTILNENSGEKLMEEKEKSCKKDEVQSHEDKTEEALFEQMFNFNEKKDKTENENNHVDIGEDETEVLAKTIIQFPSTKKKLIPKCVTLQPETNTVPVTNNEKPKKKKKKFQLIEGFFLRKK